MRASIIRSHLLISAFVAALSSGALYARAHGVSKYTRVLTRNGRGIRSSDNNSLFIIILRSDRGCGVCRKSLEILGV